MKLLRSLSIRARITLGSVLIALIAVSIVALLMYQQIEATTHHAEVALARGDLASFESDIRSSPDNAPDKPAPGVLVYIRAPDGSIPVNTVPPEISAVLQHHAGNTGDFTVVTDGNVRYSIAADTVETPSGTWALWVARSGAQSALTNAALDRTLVLSSIILVGVFGGAAWLLTTFALRPVARMQRTARTLSVDSGGAELPVGLVHDELSELAITLNAFIKRMRDTALREREMVSAASHELRTPLSVVITQLELAHRHFGDAQALEQEIRSAEHTLARLSMLAGNLLELSRLDAADHAGQSGIASELESELMEAVDRGRLIAGVSGPEIELATEIDNPSATYGLSASAFSRILDNLLANSLRATPMDGRILLDLHQYEGSIILTVSDTGHGIPDEFIQRAFERFTRPDEARTMSDGGSGLGLALVAGIARNAGGFAAIANGAAGGAVVTLTFPVR